MYIVTGGAGFIGSALVTKLNKLGIDKVLIVDNLGHSDKWKNLVGKSFLDFEHKDTFIKKIEDNSFNKDIQCIFHMGACSSTTERDANYIINNNYNYSKTLAKFAVSRNVRFIYASSASVYGDGKKGFSDSDSLTPSLAPMNIYGYSKQLFDIWALKTKASSAMTGLRFFNVYGPNEYHKDNMCSLVFKAFNQIKETGKVKLFKSYDPRYKDGEQCRDFIYVKDCIDVMASLMERRDATGIFNLGSGVHRTWKDLVSSVFSSLGLKENIEFIKMPENLIDRYQYYTKSDISKLKEANVPFSPRSLENGISDYILNHLVKDTPYY